MPLSIELPPAPQLHTQWPDAPWMPHALGELGQHEFPGGADNPRILEYIATCTHNPGLLHDETAWCSAYLNWCMEQAGVARTHSLAARSWETWGREVVAPFVGCIVVYWRSIPGGVQGPASPNGHVGIYMGATKDAISTLGGNERDQVNVLPYPAIRRVCYRQAA